jgi:hypothetical protein
VVSWRRTCRIVLTLIATAAFASALGHYLLFSALDGTLVDDRYLQQPQVSAISLLLVTIFKASFTAGVGTCFAQFLWWTLRGMATAIAIVEKLFLLRSNLFALANARSAWKAPVLFLMALAVWCIGIATIYPPGALIVVSLPYASTQNLNMSVWQPEPIKTFNPMFNLTGISHPTLSIKGKDGFPETPTRQLNVTYHY